MSTITLARPATGHPGLGAGLVLTAGCLFAFNGTVSKLLMRGGFDAPQLTTIRAAGAFAGLLLLSTITSRGPSRLAASRAELPRLVAFGFIGFFLVPTLYFVTINRLPIGIGLLFEFTGPVFVALWVRFGQHRQVKQRLWLGLALCLTGLACVAEVWGGELRLDPLGVTAGLLSAVALAVYYLVGTKLVAQRDPISLTCWAFGISAVVGAIVRPWWDFPTHLLTNHSDGMPIWLLLGSLMIFGTLTPYLLVTASMQHLPPTSVGIIGTIEPVLASVFAWVLIGETLTAAQIIGGVIVLTGVVLAETARQDGGHAP